MVISSEIFSEISAVGEYQAADENGIYITKLPKAEHDALEWHVAK